MLSATLVAPSDTSRHEESTVVLTGRGSALPSRPSASPGDSPRPGLEAAEQDRDSQPDAPRPGPEPTREVRDPAPSWDEVATKYGRKIYSIAYRLTGDVEEAKDLSQDVFVRVYRNLHKYQPGTFEGWLYRITKNLFLDRMRRRRRVLLEPLPEDEWRQPEDETAGPEQRLEQTLLRSDIDEALTRLPPDFRTAVVLCDVQGLSYEEIASATGWPLGTVRSRIHRGRKLLRAHLEAVGGEGRDA